MAGLREDAVGQTPKEVIVDALLGPMPLILPDQTGKVPKEWVAEAQADVIIAAMTTAGMTIVET